MSTRVAFELLSCKNISALLCCLKEGRNGRGLYKGIKVGTYVHFDAGILKDLRVWILARREAIKLQLSAIEFNRIERSAIQLIFAAQHHRLATSHSRWLHEQVDITQRRLGGIWKWRREKAIWDLFKLMQRAWVCHKWQGIGSQRPRCPAVILSKVKPTNCQQLPGTRCIHSLPALRPFNVLWCEQKWLAALRGHICIHGRDRKTILIRYMSVEEQRHHPYQPQHRHPSAFHGHWAA